MHFAWDFFAKDRRYDVVALVTFRMLVGWWRNPYDTRGGALVASRARRDACHPLSQDGQRVNEAPDAPHHPTKFYFQSIKSDNIFCFFIIL